MKFKALSLLVSIALLCFASCTDEAQELANEQSQTLKQIVMTTQDFQPDSDSRTLYEIGEAIKCTWAANDTVGVFPEKGAQAYFPMASGAGTKNATFDGEGWALKDGKTYAAYYPFIGDMYLDKNVVPVSYVGQIQTGNASTTHLGAYDYMVAAPTTSEFGSAQFTFKHLSALVQLRITIPQPATLTSVKLVADTKAFALEGTVDIMADAPSIVSTKLANEMVLNLQDVATTEENQVVTLYMMIPPVDLSTQTLKAVIASDKGVQEIALEGRNFQAGFAYGLSGALASYKDGVLRLIEAGTMKQLLGNDYYYATSLKVIGPINGDDIACLRKMSGGIREAGENKGGKLASLDLSEATIVEGGDYYFKTVYYKFYSSKDVIGDYMFYDCKNLLDIVLPDGVISIGKNAFYSCEALVSIDIPDGVTSIGNNAFAHCSLLASIDLPDSVALIDEYTFYECASLASIDIPDGVTSIAFRAFSGCSSLTSIDIPSSITSIGQDAFYGCSSLGSVYIADLSVWYEIQFENYYSNPLSNGAKLYVKNVELTELVIPADMKQVNSCTFAGCVSLVKVTIGENVTAIGDHAFSHCTSITTLDIPAGVTSIGSRAFSGCSSLNQLYCHAITPPTINIADVNSSFDTDGHTATLDKYDDSTILYVPKGCSSKYKSSDWNSCFTTIKEME